MKLKVINAGNCMICGKPIELVDTDSEKLPDIFFCSECAKKIKKERSQNASITSTKKGSTKVRNENI